MQLWMKLISLKYSSGYFSTPSLIFSHYSLKDLYIDQVRLKKSTLEEPSIFFRPRIVFIDLISKGQAYSQSDDISKLLNSLSGISKIIIQHIYFVHHTSDNNYGWKK